MIQKLICLSKKSVVLFFISQLCGVQSAVCAALYEQPEELSIVVIIPSYNNAQYYKENLNSVFKQKYNKFRVIYINDASTDETGQLVEAYVQSSGMQDKVTIIHNEYNRKALMNIYQAVHMCDDNDLIVVLDGDDQFAHDHVLAKFNRAHADGTVWLSYAQYINWPPMTALQNKIPILGYAAQTPQDIIDAKNYRWCYKWFWSGLRGFRAWFFKCIKITSLFLDVAPHKGKLLPIMYDAAIMWPMMEMGGEHTKFIPDILLTRTMTPLNDFHVTGDELKKAVRRVLRNQKTYPTLHDRCDAAAVSDRQENRGVAVVLMSHAPDDTQSTLDLLDHTLLNKRSNEASCCVLCNNNPADVQAYQLLAEQSPSVVFLHSSDGDKQTLLSDQLIAHLQSINENHVLVIEDTSLIFSHGDSFNGWLNFDSNGVAISCQSRQSVRDRLNNCIAQLEATYAYGVYFGLKAADFATYSDQPYAQRPYEQLTNGMAAWQFKCHTPSRWPQLPALYRARDVIKILKRVSARTVDEILGQWSNQPVSGDNVGLFFAGDTHKS